MSRTPADGTDWTDFAGAKAETGFTDKALRARVARRQIPFRKLGGRIIFRRSELREFLDKLEGVGVGEALANATRERTTC